MRGRVSQSACIFAPIPRLFTSRRTTSIFPGARSSTLRHIVCCNKEKNLISECVQSYARTFVQYHAEEERERERERRGCCTHFSLNWISMPTIAIDPWAIKFVDAGTLVELSNLRNLLESLDSRVLKCLDVRSLNFSSNAKIGSFKFLDSKVSRRLEIILIVSIKL